MQEDYYEFEVSLVTDLFLKSKIAIYKIAV